MIVLKIIGILFAFNIAVAAALYFKPLPPRRHPNSIFRISDWEKT